MAWQLILQAWKGMLDDHNSLKTGWVHNLRLHRFSCNDGLLFVVIGKEGYCTIK